MGRDPAVVSELWAKVDKGQSFDLSANAALGQMPNLPSSRARARTTTASRLSASPRGATNVMLDTHRRWPESGHGESPGRHSDDRSRNRPAKVRGNHPQGAGTEPVRPADLKGIENLPQRVAVMAPDVAAIKQFIVNASDPRLKQYRIAHAMIWWAIFLSREVGKVSRTKVKSHRSKEMA